MHPQYILGLFDSEKGIFEVKQYHKCYKFRIVIYSQSIQVLYKIKKRFKNIGKVKQLTNNKYVLIFDKQLELVLPFFYTNKLQSIKKSVEFYKFSYLYEKLIVEKEKGLTEKELRRVINKLHYFLQDRVQQL